MSGPLVIGGLLFEQMDQLDFTGPFEVLSRLPDAVFHTIGKTAGPLRDVRGLILTPEMSMADAPPLDVLLVPGGTGINTLMEDEETLAFLRRQRPGLRLLFSVCTGALLCGAAGFLRGRKATTHWASHHLLQSFGALAVHERVVIDGNLLSASGVTSGLDAALTAASLLRGEDTAQKIQLYLEYSPRPPFACGTPETAPPSILQAVRADMDALISERAAVVRRAAARLED